ncbi:MAG: GNAT family N-acetyltransferase [Thermoplasmata archaeon]|nr:GNAT family N-acetyltransferase [Thermoplasmata archaeon]
MKIIEIDPGSSAELTLFLEVAEAVYRSDPIWAGEDGEKVGEALVDGGGHITSFVAMEGDVPIARASAILWPRSECTGWIGYFEAVGSADEAVSSIFERCETALREKGATSIIGPKSDDLQVGLQTGGFDLPQTVATPHNPPYYEAYFRANGFLSRKRLLTYLFDADSYTSHERAPDGFNVRRIDVARMDEEIATYNRLNNAIFSGNFGFTPKTEEEDRKVILRFLPFMDPDLILFAYDEGGTDMGMLITLPDIHQMARGHQIDRARIIMIGVLPGFERKGIGSMMLTRLIATMADKGYVGLEASWVQEDNLASREIAGRFNPRPGREFSLFQKRL